MGLRVCPAGTNHVIVSAGERPCVVLAVGAREHQDTPGWGGYTVNETALRHRAGVEQETTEAEQAYARVPHREPTAYREGWLSAGRLTRFRTGTATGGQDRERCRK